MKTTGILLCVSVLLCACGATSHTEKRQKEKIVQHDIHIFHAADLHPATTKEPALETFFENIWVNNTACFSGNTIPPSCNDSIRDQFLKHFKSDISTITDNRPLRFDSYEEVIGSEKLLVRFSRLLTASDAYTIRIDILSILDKEQALQLVKGSEYILSGHCSGYTYWSAKNTKTDSERAAEAPYIPTRAEKREDRLTFFTGNLYVSDLKIASAG